MTSTTQLIEQLVAALERIHLWADSQADAQSKGGHATFDLMHLREERDALIPALTAARAHLEQTTEPAPSLTKIEDPVTVPRGLLGAACRAIAHKDDAPNTLEQLRQYTVGNLSPSMTGKAARSLDKAWALFCPEIGEDKSPYPGMIGAFEAHYGQSSKDKDWRNEASVWAQAWSAATRATTPPQQPSQHPARRGSVRYRSWRHSTMRESW